MSGNWSIQQKKYQFWLAVPAKDRPKSLRTKRQVASALRVSESTLALWESLPGWWLAVHEHAMATLGNDLQEILTTLSEKAKSGNVPAIKLALQVLGLFTEKTEQEVTHHHDQLMVVVKPHADAPATPTPTNRLTDGRDEDGDGDMEKYLTIDAAPQPADDRPADRPGDRPGEGEFTDLIFVRTDTPSKATRGTEEEGE